LKIEETKTVQCSYQASRNDELSLEKGDQISLYLKRDSGWWLGAKGNSYGLFPHNFVK